MSETTPNTSHQKITPGKYQHYKGDHYEVIGFALHTETREKLVLYKALYPVPELHEEFGPNPTFARPYSQFASTVTIEGTPIPRFKKI